MILKLIERYIDTRAFKEELRKIGVAFITAGIVGIFLQHLVSFTLAAWLSFIGILFLIIGLVKIKKEQVT